MRDGNRPTGEQELIKVGELFTMCDWDEAMTDHLQDGTFPL
jgi:hypothetical protein